MTGHIKNAPFVFNLKTQERFDYFHLHVIKRVGIRVHSICWLGFRKSRIYSISLTNKDVFIQGSIVRNSCLFYWVEMTGRNSYDMDQFYVMGDIDSTMTCI